MTKNKKLKKPIFADELELVREELRSTKKHQDEVNKRLESLQRKSIDALTMLRCILLDAAHSVTFYTPNEIEAMSSEEYRTKVLVPLGMGRRRV